MVAIEIWRDTLVAKGLLAGQGLARNWFRQMTVCPSETVLETPMVLSVGISRSFVHIDFEIRGSVGLSEVTIQWALGYMRQSISSAKPIDA